MLAAARLVVLVLGALMAFAVGTRADHHNWQINEIYSNADGTVQFIELFTTSSGQQDVTQSYLIASGTNGVQRNRFDFPFVLIGDTEGRSVLLATPGFESLPGGVVPDYMIPANFLSLESGTVEYKNFEDDYVWDFVTYDNLPTNGIASLRRLDFDEPAMVVNATNSPTNFDLQRGSVRPPSGIPEIRLLSPALAGGAFGFSFTTVTGKTYTIEFTASLAPANWQESFGIAGTGSTVTVYNIFVPPARFYRLRVK